jgi:POT family proton-dependent oligopeptide transporter
MPDPTLADTAETDLPTVKQWFGQPRGLTVLFLTEMWDQFSFFGMRALLVLYMVHHLHIAQQKASWIYAFYAMLIYFTPIIGGIITDRWLGRRASVVIGGLIMAAGHFLMAFEPLFYVALATIAIGNGLFLPSLPSQIDSLYKHDDPRRKSAYNIYYVGINLGAFMSPFAMGWVVSVDLYHWGFAIAGIGMVIGLLTYLAGGRYLPPEPDRSQSVFTPVDGDPRAPKEGVVRRFALLIAIAACVVVFRGAYEQIGNTISLWADAADRTLLGGWAIPAPWFQSINPLMVFTLTPFFVMRWTRLAARGRETSSVFKMAIGAAIIGLSYLMIAAVSWWIAGHGGGKVSWLWVAFFVVVLTAGELYILPVGLGLFGRLAPSGLTATTIATWFAAGVAGNLWAGWLGTLYTPLPHSIFFMIIGGVALAAALLLLLVSPRAKQVEQNA